MSLDDDASIDDDEIDSISDNEDNQVAAGSSTFAIPLSDALTWCSEVKPRRPTELYDRLCEGLLTAFVRIPASFDCCLAFPLSFWRTLDVGYFAEQFGGSPYQTSRTYRAPSPTVYEMMAEALKRRRFMDWQELQAPELSLVYFLGSPHGFGSHTDDDPPTPEEIASEIQSGIHEHPERVFPSTGFCVLVRASEVEDLYSEGGISPSSRVDPRSKNWDKLWMAGIAELIDGSQGTLTQDAFATSALDCARRYNLPNLPSDATARKKLSESLKPFRKPSARR